MSTKLGTARDRDLGRVPYRFTADEVLAIAGHLKSDAELWDGVLYRMDKNEPHNFIVAQVADLLRPFVPAGYHLREEKPCRDGDGSLPEPDVALARGSRVEFLSDPPPLSRMALIVEVNHHSARADHGDKLRRYAEVGVPVYWVVEVAERLLFVHDGPSGRGGSAGYGRRAVYPVGESVPVVIDGREVAQVPTAEIFPPDRVA